MQMTTIVCAECGAECSKRKAEIDRWLRRGRTRFFCSCFCAGTYGNKEARSPLVTKFCPVCGELFETRLNKYEKTFCSRACASAGSVTPFRKARAKEMAEQNFTTGIEQSATGLRAREWYKYDELHSVLVHSNIDHYFEYPIENIGICDLVIKDQKIIIEFDGTGHDRAYQIKIDEQRDRKARARGWTVHRLSDPIVIDEVKETLQIR